MTPHYYVAEKIDAKVKLAWIHTDYSNYLLDIRSELQMWGKYDYIASISPKCTEGFLKVFPELKDKIVEISNINAENLIRRQAKDESAGDMNVESAENVYVRLEDLHRRKTLIMCLELQKKCLKKVWNLNGF